MNDKYKWYGEDGALGDVVISSRVRLARNVRGFPFTGRITGSQRAELLGRIGAVADGFEYVDMQSLQPVMRGVLYEWHLISPEFAHSELPRALLLGDGVSIMVGEEDHLRIQALRPGLDLRSCLELAGKADHKLDASLNFSFDDRLGYLTHCPTNLGTGMRASAMLHLPAMTRTGALRGVMPSLGKLGVTVRGLYGEGTDQAGCLYQFSNQVTLGISEDETIDKLQNILEQIIKQEQGLRAQLYKAEPVAVEDRVWRSLGTLRSARLMSSGEFMNLASDVRLGVSLGIIKDITLHDVNALIFEAQPAGVLIKSPDAEEASARDMARARMLRERMGA